MINKWTETDNHHLYHQEHNGRIIGQAHRLGVSGPWYVAKVCEHLSVDFTPIGNYIDLQSAKNAIEHYWHIQNNTIAERYTELLK
jgi:hypothetical protein